MPSTFTTNPRIIPRLLRTSAIALTLCLSHYGWSATLPAGLTWESNNADPAFADPAAKRGGTFAASRPVSADPAGVRPGLQRRLRRLYAGDQSAAL